MELMNNNLWEQGCRISSFNKLPENPVKDSALHLKPLRHTHHFQKLDKIFNYSLFLN